jgi:sarcosine oxidase subunit beta
LVGQRSWRDIPLASPDCELPAADEHFIAEVREPLLRRMPHAKRAVAAGGRSGVLDMTPDGLPLVGPGSVEGLWLCCGWSGTGFKTAPAVGEALAGWLDDGSAPACLAAFEPTRQPKGSNGPRSPH